MSPSQPAPWPQHPREHGRPVVFWSCVALAMGLWAAWCVLAEWIGEPFSLPLVRAVARITIVLAPALLYLRLEGSAPDAFGLRTRWQKGLVVGAAVVVVHMTVLSVFLQFDFSTGPTVAHWLNVIVFSPFAEELLFRRVAIDYFMRRHGVVFSAVASAALFALIHVPQWAVVHEHPMYVLGAMTGGAAVMFTYGIAFAVLYRLTGSLWACLLPHWANNLAGAFVV